MLFSLNKIGLLRDAIFIIRSVLSINMNLQSDEEENIGGSKKYEIRGFLDLSWYFYFIDR